MKKAVYYTHGSTGVRRALRNPIRLDAEIWDDIIEILGGLVIWLGLIGGFWAVLRFIPI